MAAKVVMVAVPAVLGAASIRVYRVSDQPTEGLVTKERLNVYYPLHSSPQPQDIPHQPGVIESGFSSARLTILPVVQAVKGAYVSVKTGTIKCYHTGQDMYYYLKDPPPEFLPRFGTITMAGLLGMLLARKGSRLSRVALPLGLMTAGASVCYPAQTAAVVKVAGKKAYAAGQWTSASVSSLLSSPPKPPAAAEEAALSPAEKVPPPEPAAAVVESVPSTHASGSPIQSSPAPETGEKPPAPEEPSVGSAAPTETTAEQTSAEPSAVAETVAEPGAITSELPTEDTQPASAEESTTPSPPATEEPAVDTEKEPEAESPAPAEAPPPSEEPAPESAKETAVEPEIVVEPVVASEPPPVAPEDATAPAPSSTEEPAPPTSKGGAGFKADPALMDFGQSDPEDADLYSTRS
uniref:MICOS complex subunit n=1 Tax=Neogobius melanostomus TaxID=47308 RepID=A0A8C6U4C7_9GOBI